MQLPMTWIPCLAVVCATACIPECGQREMEAQEDLNVALDGVGRYRTSQEVAPTSLDDLVPPRCPPSACVFEQRPRDPWGNQYQLSNDAGKVAVRSAGRDGITGTADDIVLTE